MKLETEAELIYRLAALSNAPWSLARVLYETHESGKMEMLKVVDVTAIDLDEERETMKQDAAADKAMKAFEVMRGTKRPLPKRKAKRTTVKLGDKAADAKKAHMDVVSESLGACPSSEDIHKTR